jgi:hypothetical protein
MSIIYDVSTDTLITGHIIPSGTNSSSAKVETVQCLTSNQLFLQRCSVRLYLQFVGGCVSYLRYLCLFVHSVVQHICCVFVLFFFFLCTLCCLFLWIVLFWLPLRYSLTFISSYIQNDRVTNNTLCR